MTSFQGTMRIQGETGPPVPVRARVGDERLVLEVDGVEVGEWPVSGLNAHVDGGGIRLRLGEDRVMIDVTDRIAFVSALVPPKVANPRRPRRRLHLRFVAAGAAVLAAVAAAVLVPELVGSVCLLTGLMGLAVGALAHSEPRVALRLPLNLHAVHFILTGLILLALGVALVLIA